jgi:hypothetical protein
MTSLSTTIKRKYFDAIVKGEKHTEYKATSPFWRKHIEGKGLGLDRIVFLCGKDVHKRQILMIQEVKTESWLKGMVDTPTMYAIHLGLSLDDKETTEKSECKT